MRFELTRAKPNGFLVHLLNHSDTVSSHSERTSLFREKPCHRRTPTMPHVFLVMDRPTDFGATPNIAQLVERSTVEKADIEWSLVRFRVFGILERFSQGAFLKL